MDEDMYLGYEVLSDSPEEYDPKAKKDKSDNLAHAFHDTRPEKTKNMRGNTYGRTTTSRMPNSVDKMGKSRKFRQQSGPPGHSSNAHCSRK